MSKPDAQYDSIILVSIGCALACVAYFWPGTATGQQALFQLATTIVGGALGVYVSQSKPKADVTTGNAPVTINQGDTTVSPPAKN